MNKEVLAELRKVEQELAKLSKLKATKTTKQRQLKLTRRKISLEAKIPKTSPVKPEEKVKTVVDKPATKPKSKPSTGEHTSTQAKPSVPKVKYKAPKQEKPKKKKEKSENKKPKPKKTPRKNPKSKKELQKKKQNKINNKKKKKQSLSEPLKTIPFGTVPDTGEVKVSEPMSLTGMLITGIVDRIEQALDGRSELVTIHPGEGTHVDTAEYNGTFISARSYHERLEIAAGGTVLLKICEEAKKEADLINANDERALKAFEDGNLVSNILVSKQREILTRLFMWVFDSDRKVEDLSDIDALFPFTEAFGGTKYEAELNKALDEAANEDMDGGIEREEYDPKNTFTGYITGREYVILPDESIQPVSDKLILFQKGSDGLYEIGGKKYTLKEAIERL